MVSVMLDVVLKIPVLKIPVLGVNIIINNLEIGNYCVLRNKKFRNPVSFTNRIVCLRREMFMDDCRMFGIKERPARILCYKNVHLLLRFETNRGIKFHAYLL